MKRLSIIGSTGSIGRNTLSVVSRYPERFEVVGIAARRNISLLEQQIRIYKARVAALLEEEAARELLRKGLDVRVLSGMEGLIEVVTLDEVDMVVSAMVGSAGLIPTLAAIRSGKDIALANKEVLVMAGSIIMAEASRRGVRIVPVDSEHSAIFQCIDGRKKQELKRIILTASGGPFLRKSISELSTVTPEATLKHPTWNMGTKVTIDSATMMNKGLEVIEAHWLFNLPPERIDVLLHPQSIVHSMVEFIDGSVMAQMSVPDMRGPISYALSYPERLEGVLPCLNLHEIRELTFEQPDSRRYPCLSLTYEALRAGGTMPSVLNTANEVAVEAFLNKRILFTDIYRVVADTMMAHKTSRCEGIEDVLEASDWARHKAEGIVKEIESCR